MGSHGRCLSKGRIRGTQKCLGHSMGDPSVGHW